MTTITRAWHPVVTLAVLAMAIGSLATGNDAGATAFLFAVAGVNLAVLMVQRRQRSRM